MGQISESCTPVRNQTKNILYASQALTPRTSILTIETTVQVGTQKIATYVFFIKTKKLATKNSHAITVFKMSLKICIWHCFECDMDLSQQVMAIPAEPGRRGLWMAFQVRR
jgi:hypothetical protein